MVGLFWVLLLTAGLPGASEKGSLNEITSKSGIAMVRIPGGTFVMGTDHGVADNRPAHKVAIGSFFGPRCTELGREKHPTG